MTDIKKAAVPIPSVGADGEQSQYANTENIIANAPEQINEKAENPPGKVDLRAISMMELYDTSYSPKEQIVDGLLYAGIYLFVGAPKIGKSFFMAQLSYHIATGTPSGSMMSIRARFSTSLWRTITRASRSVCSRCSAWKEPIRSTSQRSPARWAED